MEKARKCFTQQNFFFQLNNSRQSTKDIATEDKTQHPFSTDRPLLLVQVEYNIINAGDILRKPEISDRKGMH